MSVWKRETHFFFLIAEDQAAQWQEQLRLLYLYLCDSCFSYLNDTLSEVNDSPPWLSQNPVSSTAP